MRNGRRIPRIQRLIAADAEERSDGKSQQRQRKAPTLVDSTRAASDDPTCPSQLLDAERCYAPPISVKLAWGWKWLSTLRMSRQRRRIPDLSRAGLSSR